MASDPAVSVILPVYNARRYIGKSLQSILKQDFTDFELLVLDDGSTDGSREIVAEYMRQDPRLRLFRREHRGLVPLLNEGIHEARGKLVARMDADDVAMPHRFRDQVDRFAQSAELVVLGGQAELIDAVGLPIGVRSFPLEHEQIEEAMLRGGDDFICHPSTMLRRDAVRDAGGYRDLYPHAEDLDLWLRLAERGKLANLSQVLLKYRLHFGSVCLAQADAQNENAYACVLAALRRRGLPEQVLTEHRCLSVPTPGRADVYRDWSAQAFHHRHWHTAAFYACKALAADPRSFAGHLAGRAARAWRQVFRALGR